jgi:hypothetical protein
MDDSAPRAVSGLRTEVFVLKRGLMLLNILRHGIKGGGHSFRYCTITWHLKKRIFSAFYCVAVIFAF